MLCQHAAPPSRPPADDSQEDIPYCKSKMHVWQTFLSLAHVWQTSVFLKRMPLPGHQRNTVNGRVQIFQPGTRAGIFVSIPRRVFRARRNQVLHARTLHSWPYGSFVCVSPQQHACARSSSCQHPATRVLSPVVRARPHRSASSRTMRTYGLSPKHVSHRIGKSCGRIAVSPTTRARSLIARLRAHARARASARLRARSRTVVSHPCRLMSVFGGILPNQNRTRARALSRADSAHARARKGGESGREGFPIGKKRRRRSGNRAAISRRAGHSRKDLK